MRGLFYQNFNLIESFLASLQPWFPLARGYFKSVRWPSSHPGTLALSLLSPRLLTSSVTSGPRDWTHAKALNRVVSSPAPKDMSWLLCSPVGAVGVARA